MNAGLLKRAGSTIVDMIILLGVVALTFFIAGRQILQNRIENYDAIHAAYTEIMDAYQEDASAIYTAYQAEVELADGDEDLEAAALATYTSRVSILKAQNLIDIDPYNRELTSYYLTVIYYFTFGFILIQSVYSVALNGKTLGRKLFKLELAGSVNPITIFVHDVVLKYLFVALIVIISPIIGAILLIALLFADLLMVGFSRNKLSLRDIISRVKVTSSSSWSLNK